jgi:hypothetical protein
MQSGFIVFVAFQAGNKHDLLFTPGLPGFQAGRWRIVCCKANLADGSVPWEKILPAKIAQANNINHTTLALPRRATPCPAQPSPAMPRPAMPSRAQPFLKPNVMCALALKVQPLSRHTFSIENEKFQFWLL